jgi:hypothetical protein
VGEEGRRARFTHAIAAIRAVSRPEMSNVVGEADDQEPGPGWNAQLATTAAVQRALLHQPVERQLRPRG